MGTQAKTVLSIAALVGLSGIGVAYAAPVPATLVSVGSYGRNSTTPGDWTATAANTATWTFDTTTNTLAIASGTYARVAKVGSTPLMTHTMTGVTMSAGIATATTWSCTEGVFGGIIGAHICGNYNFGSNYTNDSVYTPSTVGATVTIGGDDIALGDPQTLANSYSNFNPAVAIPGAATGFQRYTFSNGADLVPGAGDSATGFDTGYLFTFDIPVTPAADAVNDGPVVTAPSTPTLIPVGANDIGFTDPVTVTVSTAPAHGIITAISDTGAAAAQTITYTASPGYTGPDTFVYSMTDGASTDTATVTITVQPAQANDDIISISNGAATSINVLANDQAFANPATVTITAGPNHGVATVSGSPGNKSAIRINYTPTTGYAGPDSITYEVDDGFNSDTATVAITVLVYKANNDNFVVSRDNCCQYLYVARNDVGFGSQVSVTLIQSPDHNGSAYVQNSPGTKNDVNFYYYPYSYNYPNDYTETFRYQISDGVHTDTATVSVEVVRYKAIDDQAVTGVGTPVTIGVTTNDIGFAYYNKTVGIYTTPQHGSLSINGNGGSSPSITYSPAPGFMGTDTFEYAIDDGARIDIATVTVAVIIDLDNDLVDDAADNCLGAANNSQRDTDGDGYGNWCDADLNNDMKVNFADLAIFRARFATSNADADLDGNGNVNFADLARFRALFGKPPGPSATAP
ncbi:MAG: hypothetical protein KDI87_03480 [Gammaproteobacteria bacterium]|nr:hypothetical protein [Gammaproteobacteria bacterium]MCP5139082.1 hypothetical protein [Chromatiales bacterium]